MATARAEKRIVYVTRAQIMAAEALIESAERRGDPVNPVYRMIAEAGKYSAEDTDRDVIVLPKPLPARG